MKRFLAIVLAGLIGASASWLVLSKNYSAQAAKAQQEKLALETALRDAQAQLATRQKIEPIQPASKIVEVIKKQSPKEIIAYLQTLRVSSGDTKNIRLVIQQFENLIQLGKEALPEIKAFLAQKEEINYDPTIFGSWKVSKEGHVPIDFVFPPSLRFGLFDVVQKIGGADAEKLLADTLHITGRGVEIAYLARVLQEMAPFKYRELALSAAKDLLSNPVNSNQANPLDKFDRNYLFGVLAFYRDGSLINQVQLVQADGIIDKATLNYLQQTLGEKAIPVIAQAYQDGRITDANQKEPLARLALNFAGTSAEADTMYRMTINDKSLPENGRRELIEDLNRDGFENEKHPTERDLQLAKNRLELIKQYRGDADSKILNDAFNEAEKDLLDMLPKKPKSPATP
ncbi:MAG: hypothetical protein ACR2H1_04600 [Limisphaerales bacterium]